MNPSRAKWGNWTRTVDSTVLSWIQTRKEARKASPGFDKTSRRLEAAVIKWKKKRGLCRKSPRDYEGRRFAGGVVDASRPHPEPWRSRMIENKRRQKLLVQGLAIWGFSEGNRGEFLNFCKFFDLILMICQPMSEEIKFCKLEIGILIVIEGFSW